MAAAAPEPPDLYGLPPTLRLSTHPTRGRCLIATRAIPANTLLLLSLPACVFPARSDRCSHCLLPSPQLQCKVCKASYCSPACQAAAWPEHKHECKLLKGFTSKEGQKMVPVHVWIPMLLLARVLRGARAGKPLEGAPLPSGIPLPAHPTLAAVQAMQAPSGGDTGVSGEAAGVIALGRQLGLFPASATDEAIAQMHNAMQLNNFSPMDESLAPVAFGCYPAAALMNHSCRPNAALSYGFLGTAQWPGEGGAGEGRGEGAPPPALGLRTAMAVRSLLPIAEGEEVCHAYLDITLPRAVRAGDLRARYGFSCDCPTCAVEQALEGAEAGAARVEDTPGFARAKAMIMRSREIATEPTLKRECGVRGHALCLALHFLAHSLTPPCSPSLSPRHLQSRRRCSRPWRRRARIPRACPRTGRTTWA